MVIYWEAHDDSELGAAIVAHPKSLLSFDTYEVNKKDMSNAYANLKLEETKVIYYTDFG